VLTWFPDETRGAMIEKAGMSCESVSIDALLQDLFFMIEPLVSNAGLSITQHGASGLDIDANPVRIKQVIPQSPVECD